MADEGGANHPVRRLTWTFKVRGGNAFTLMREGCPRVEHDGHLSLWTLVLTPEEAKQFEWLARGYAATVERFAEVEGPEQVAERENLLAAQAQDMVFPTVRCPECFWLDVNLPGLCGLVGWDAAVRAEATRVHEKARVDAVACPLT